MRKHTKKARRTLTVFAAVLLAVTFLLPVGASASSEIPWNHITGILRATMDREDFYWDLDQEPLVCKSDANGDGIWEVLTLYLVKDPDDPMVRARTELWLIDTWTDDVEIGNGSVLFEEVGGNSGDISLAEKDGTLYIIARSSMPDGGDFHDLISIFTVADRYTDMAEEQIFMQRDGSYGAEDDALYQINLTPVSRWDYEDLLDEYDVLYTMDLFAEPDPDCDYDVVPFNVLLT